MKMNIQQLPTLHSQDSPEREVHSNTELPEDRNISNKQPNPTCKRTRGTTTKQSEEGREEGNNQDQRRIE